MHGNEIDNILLFKVDLDTQYKFIATANRTSTVDAVRVDRYRVQSIVGTQKGQRC